MAEAPVDRPTPAERAEVAREKAVAAGERARLTFRRLNGLDRSGPPPPETRRDAPWRPWTIPNAITYFRFALLPVFMVLALTSDSGTDALPAILFAVIGWGDYADGIAARVTGQYSRLGTLLDPVIDRALVLAGLVVCWHFELLPRWALALLAVRELATLVRAEVSLRRGIDLEINWIGRIAVFLVFGGMFWSMVVDWWVIRAAFVVGVGVAIAATLVYVRVARSHIAAERNLMTKDSTST